MKGSSYTGAHEYSHGLDDNGEIKKAISNIKPSDSQAVMNKKFQHGLNMHNKNIENLNKKDDFDKKVYTKEKEHKEKTGRGFRQREKEPEEIRADMFSVSSINGENAANVNKKNLNEKCRRTLQSSVEERRKKSTYEKLKDGLNHTRHEIKSINKKLKVEKNPNVKNDMNETLKELKRDEKWHVSKINYLRTNYPKNYKQKACNIRYDVVENIYKRHSQQDADRMSIVSSLIKDQKKKR